jgi:low affinity Fe/Cu permease
MMGDAQALEAIASESHGRELLVIPCGERRKQGSGMKSFFSAFAEKTSEGVGSPWAFIVAASVVVIWAITGPLFDYSDTWQLVINTGTTVVTFLVVFLIQNAQNRNSRAMHLKLDELIAGLKGPRSSMVDLESLSDDELDKLHQQFQSLRERLKDDPGVADEDSVVSMAEETVDVAEDAVEDARERRAS